MIKAVSDLLDKLSQSQFTIPKSVANEIDTVVNPIGQIVLISGFLSDFTDEARSWIHKNNEHRYIAIAYANQLTHDLVKVDNELGDCAQKWLDENMD